MTDREIINWVAQLERKITCLQTQLGNIQRSVSDLGVSFDAQETVMSNLRIMGVLASDLRNHQIYLRDKSLSPKPDDEPK